jgi:hypothetical protein
MFESGARETGGDVAPVRAGVVPSGNVVDGAEETCTSSLLDLALASLLTRALEVREECWSHDATQHEPFGPGPAIDPAAIDPAKTEPAGAGVWGVDAVVLGKAAALCRTSLADVGEDALIDAVVGWQHVASWAAAAQARVVGELLARGGGSSAALEAVTHELTAALVTSRHTAGRVAGRAAGLSASPEVADALADGRIDTARADALLVSETVPVGVRRRVAADLVGTPEQPGPATGLTPRQLRDRLRRAAIEADPDAAVRRAATAAAGRHVWIDPAPDQMAWLTAHLPAADAARIWARLDATARQAVRLAGEDRTLGQLRADTLTQLLTMGVDDTGTPAAHGGGRSTTSTSTSTSTSAPIGCGTVGPAEGGAVIPAEGGVVIPVEGGEPARPVPAVKTVVHVTVAATTLLGMDESPAQLAGYGPVPAAIARVLAADEDATWRRILTDPTTGAALDVSRTGYRPGTVLGDLVRTRDPVCTFPGCHVPAVRCDLDHIEPFDPGRGSTGQTRAANLHPVCRAHHNAKTHGGWSTRADDDGTITWRAPSGHEYHVPPTPSDPTHAPDAVRPARPRPRPRRTEPHDPGAPPSATPAPGDPLAPMDPLGDPPF